MPHSYDDGKDHNVDVMAALKQSEPGDLLRTKDGKPCRTCHDFRSWIKMVGNGGAAAQQASNKDIKAFSQEQLEQVQRESKQCPADKDDLGRSTWRLLHTLSVQYPNRPSQQEQGDLRQFVGLLAKLYPCKPCAEDFQQDLVLHPPVVTSGEKFAQWLCGAHNRVNQKLGKEVFDCSKVFERWRDGWADSSCDQ